MVGTKKERITTLEDQVTQLKSMVNYLVKRIEMNEKVVDKLGDIVDDFLDAYSGATLHGPQIISTAKSEISELGCAWAKEGNDLEDDFSETLHVYYNDEDTIQ